MKKFISLLMLWSVSIFPSSAGKFTAETSSGGGGGGGISSINGDSTAAQTLATGTSGTDFAIADNGSGTHTFNLPTASAVNRGALSSANWTTFNNKLTSINADSTAAQVITSGTAGTDVAVATAAGTTTINIPTASATVRGALSSANWSTFNAKLTSINGDTTAAQVIASGTAGTDVAVSTAAGTTTINIPTASATNRGALSSADWSTFNGKQATVSFGAFGSTPNSAGGGISAGTITLQPADGSNPGGVSTTTQTFAGNKTFAGNVIMSGTTVVQTTATDQLGYRNLTGNFDGGGSAISASSIVYVVAPFSCTIVSWTILGDVSGSTVVDVWKDTYANYPPTVADTIAGSEKPTISAAVKGQDLSLSTWTTTVTAGDILAFNVDSASTITRLSVNVRCRVTN